MNHIVTNAATMNSKEIAELVGSRHDKTKQSIERLADQGVIVLPPLGVIPFVDDSGRNRTFSAYIFSGEKGKRDSIIVVAQLSPEFTARLVDRWQELEAQIAAPAAPAMPKNPMLAMMVQQAMELDRIEQAVAVIDQRQAKLENRIASVEIKHRNGVPAGYLSKKQAHHLYSQGIAEKPFHDALSAMQIETVPYIHTGEDGYESMTYAYPEDMVGHYAADFIASAVQATLPLFFADLHPKETHHEHWSLDCERQTPHHAGIPFVADDA